MESGPSIRLRPATEDKLRELCTHRNSKLSPDSSGQKVVGLNHFFVLCPNLPHA